MTGISAVDTLRRVVSLPNLDLNLLLSLDALLEQRGVTRAAQQLGLSQPALSASLARLRRHFGDELLSRAGNEYRLTPLAVQLKPRVRLALQGVERVFTALPEFDPAESTREFSVLTSDYASALLGSALAGLFTEEAPAARLRLAHNTPDAVDRADQTLQTTDLLVLPHGFLTDLRHADLIRDRWVIVVDAENPEVGETISLEQLGTLPWVATYYGPTASTPAARVMRMLGVEPRVEVVTESFLAVPGLVAGSSRIGLLQERLVGLLPTHVAVRAVPCPFEAGPLVDAMWWHPVYDRDPEHTWFRGVVERAAALAAG